MFKRMILYLMVGLIITGLLGGFFSRPITILDDASLGTATGEDGQYSSRRIRAVVWTVGQALSKASLTLGPADQVEPALDQPVPLNGTIHIRRAVYLSVWENGRARPIYGLERSAGELLARHSISLAPEDRLLWDGSPLDHTQPLPTGRPVLIQVERAVPVKIVDGETTHNLLTSRQTVAGAVWEAGIRPGPGDRLSHPAGQVLKADDSITYQPARPLTIQVSGQTLQARSAAATVGQALAEAGLALQGFDYARPSANQPLPADGKIRVVRVREEIVLKEDLLPFDKKVEPDPNLDLDLRKVTTPGQYGVKVARERIRYEDGQEVSRGIDSDWIASEPSTQIVGVGTRITPRKLDTPAGEIEYYRAVQVYATSYSPCRLGVPKCSSGTSSGMQLARGVIAVTLTWYRMFAGQQVYVPGYGIATIGDVGGGISGRYWIDLGFTDEEYEQGAMTGWTTLYFLTPAPANVPWSLP